MISICFPLFYIVFKIVLAMISGVIKMPFTVMALVAIINMPTSNALAGQNPFPDITFKVFSNFIAQTFGPTVSLSTVLLLVFTVLENPELLSLHARQQCCKYEGENTSSASGWLKHLARTVQSKLGTRKNEVFRRQDISKEMSDDQVLAVTTTKLVSLAQILQFYPLDNNGNFLGKLKPISQESIQPVLMICPTSVQCMKPTCNPRSLLQATKTRDIPKVTLIKNFTTYKDVPVLTGKCPACLTLYHADHDRVKVITEQDTWNRVYLNSAKYLKVGQSTWVDRSFSNAVLNGMYSFHASTAAYTEFWNNTFCETRDVSCQPMSRRHIWQAFVQESIRTISAASDIPFEIKDGLAIDEVTKGAFEILGENGIIRAADQHACSECTHKYKKTADKISGDDPAALVGNDENQVVPPLVGEGAVLAVRDAAMARENARNQVSGESNEPMDADSPPVTMVVMDGICAGPLVCW
jgi:hypothetical protein